MAMYPKEADVILDELTAAAAAARGQGRLAPALMNSEYETLHKHTFYILQLQPLCPAIDDRRGSPMMVLREGSGVL